MNQENIFDKQRRALYYELMHIGLEQQECWAEADLIMEHVTGLKREQQIVSDLDEFKADWLPEIRRIIDLRRERRPLAYCLHEVKFAGLMFRIVPGVLIPRTDTEALVESVLEYLCRDGLHPPAPVRIAEIGVGSGIIAISLLKRLPQCTVWACDTSETAVTLTLGNARRHNVHDRLTLVHGDWKKVLPNDFDIIVSNPPYLPLSLLKDEPAKLQPELAFEPKSALFDGSEDGLSFYRQFAGRLPSHFSRPQNTSAYNAPLHEITPFAVFEIGDKQDKAVLETFKQNGWGNMSVKADVNDLPRVVIASPPNLSPPRG
jgi:release factor glutamine methyltransferase